MDIVAAAVANHRARFRLGAERVEAVGDDELCLWDGTATLGFPRSAAAVDAACARLHELRPREAAVWAAADEPELGERLLGRGFQDGWWPHWMGADLARVRDRPQLPVDPGGAPYADDLPYAHPPVRGEHEVVVVEDGVAIGHARLFPWDGAGGIYDVGVVPGARRRGIGRALTLAICELARELGCPDVVLNATAEGEELYRALGFESAGFGRTWWWFPSCGAYSPA